MSQDLQCASRRIAKDNGDLRTTPHDRPECPVRERHCRTSPDTGRSTISALGLSADQAYSLRVIRFQAGLLRYRRFFAVPVIGSGVTVHVQITVFGAGL
jgi:hypothetical protein